ncbi:hypothetical protein ABGV42_01145 [Paenibacillus pabuli]|uniref:hypothetical protein n=1 Tax=Paenibacillus pabuli TaxID=1472 RepID=UPI00324236B2
MFDITRKARAIPHKFKESGKLQVQPYGNSERLVIPVCRKKLEDYHIYVHKEWEGNGFGHSSLIIIWEIATSTAYVVNTSTTFSEMVRYLEQAQLGKRK